MEWTKTNQEPEDGIYYDIFFQGRRVVDCQYESENKCFYGNNEDIYDLNDISYYIFIPLPKE